MQVSPRCSYIGIAYGSGVHPLAIACLDARQKVQALSLGRLADIHAFCSGQPEAMVVCGLPLQRPLSGVCRPEESELQLRGLPSPLTPAAPQDLGPSARLGQKLAEVFHSLGYQTDLAVEGPLHLAESHPAAGFHHLLGLKPFEHHSLEGRLQRQLMLFEREMPIPDPMDFFEEVTRHKMLHGILPTREIYVPAELDALLMAHLAWQLVHQPENVLPLGPGYYLPQPIAR